jgi:hypothetical protein
MRHLTAEHFWKILARRHNFGAGNEGREEAVKFFDVHRVAALGLRKEFSESVELSVRQIFLLGKSIHGHVGSRLTPVDAYPAWERCVNYLG